MSLPVLEREVHWSVTWFQSLPLSVCIQGQQQYSRSITEMCRTKRNLIVRPTGFVEVLVVFCLPCVGRDYPVRALTYSKLRISFSKLW